MNETEVVNRHGLISGNHELSHISEEETSLQHINEIENASFSWIHVKICMVSGVGFFVVIALFWIHSTSLLQIVLNHIYFFLHKGCL